MTLFGGDIVTRVHRDKADRRIIFERGAAISGSRVVTRARLVDVLEYDRTDGTFRWKRCLTNAVAAGRPAGVAHPRGYIHIQIDGRKYKAHRLAWLYVYGEWPASMLDHIDGNPGNNRIENLRLADARTNQANARRRVDNTSGFKGASFHKDSGKWFAKICDGGRVINLGLFETVELAHAAYMDAAVRLKGEFARAA